VEIAVYLPRHAARLRIAGGNQHVRDPGGGCGVCRCFGGLPRRPGRFRAAACRPDHDRRTILREGFIESIDDAAERPDVEHRKDPLYGYGASYDSKSTVASCGSHVVKANELFDEGRVYIGHRAHIQYEILRFKLQNFELGPQTRLMHEIVLADKDRNDCSHTMPPSRRAP